MAKGIQVRGMIYLNKIQMMNRKKFRNKNIINLSLSENLYKIPFKVLLDIKAEYHKINLYPVGIHEELRSRIAEYHDLQKNNVLIGNGLDEMILIASLTLAKEHKKVMITENTFQGYVESAKICNLEIIKSKIENNRICVNDILTRISKDLDFIILCNPLNPYGTIITQDESNEIVSKAQSMGIYVIIDEAYGDFANKDKFKSSIDLIDKYDNLIVYRSFSKYFGIAGLRCGYALSNYKNIVQMSSIEGALPYRVNRIACRAAMSCLRQKCLYDKIAQKIQYNKIMLYKMLYKEGIQYVESETNFILLKFNENIDIANLCKKLLNDYQITVKNGNDFGLSHCIRVGIGTKKQMRYFVKSLHYVLSEFENNLFKRINLNDRETMF